MTEEKENRLTLLHFVRMGERKGGQIWMARCSCGKEVEVLRTLVVHGKKRSCGCLRQEAYHAKRPHAKKRGMSQNISYLHTLPKITYRQAELGWFVHQGRPLQIATCSPELFRAVCSDALEQTPQVKLRKRSSGVIHSISHLVGGFSATW